MNYMVYLLDILMYCYGKTRSYLQPYIYIDDELDEIIPNFLYISDFASACNYQALQTNGITHILCLILGVDPMFPKDFKYLNIHLDDRPDVQLSDHFDQCVDFIEQAKISNGKVLVHCMCGISRSSTVIAAYLIKTKGMTVDQSIKCIRRHRGCIEPNPGFKLQLENYYTKINGYNADYLRKVNDQNGAAPVKTDSPMSLI